MMTRSEEELHQFVCTEDLAKLSKGKEWNQKNCQNRDDGQYSAERSSANLRNAFTKRFAVIPANSSFLENFETTQHNSESGRLEERWIDQWFLLEIVSEMKRPSDQHDFAKGESVEERDPVRDKRKTLFR